MDTKQVFSVTSLNNYLKSVIDSIPSVNNCYIQGELSNYKIYPSGHHYFTLKDETSTLKCVMFKSNAFRMRFRPENGMKVICSGSISVYPRDGVYQLYCTNITSNGVGDLHIAYEQLKEKLFKAGLFDKNHKKPIPLYPQKIVIITSTAGAAIHDLLRILRARYPIAKVLVLPVRVQGPEAANEIANAIKYANEKHLGDLIITGRGGGSIEDLWSFNEECVAYAIYNSEIPVISAVGHEPDVTISDYVSDLRAATPSNAAEIAVPNQHDIQNELSNIQSRIDSSILNTINTKKFIIEKLKEKKVLKDPRGFIEEKHLHLDAIDKKLNDCMQHKHEILDLKIFQIAASLDALSPLKVLGRGYSITENSDGIVIHDSSQINIKENLSITLNKGKLICEVKEIIDSCQN